MLVDVQRQCCSSARPTVSMLVVLPHCMLLSVSVFIGQLTLNYCPTVSIIHVKIIVTVSQKMLVVMLVVLLHCMLLAAPVFIGQLTLFNVFITYKLQSARSFLPRDAMQARSLLSSSVRLSVTFVDHVKTNKDIFEIFLPSVATPFQVFHTKRGGDIPTVTPLTGASNTYKGYEKMTIFDQYLALSQKRLQLDGHMQRDNL